MLQVFTTHIHNTFKFCMLNCKMIALYYINVTGYTHIINNDKNMLMKKKELLYMA